MAPSLKEFSTYLNSVQIPIRLACESESGWPVVISLWYLFENDQLLCATQKFAKVITYLKRDPRCGFEIAGDLLPYCGVRGQALATIDETRGKIVLEHLLTRYLGGHDSSLARELLAKSSNEVAIIIKPERIYSWDFRLRMQELVHSGNGQKTKICP